MPTRPSRLVRRTRQRVYLNMDRIVDIAKMSGAEAIHPGYGFLAENYRFAKLCADEGVTFIGPKSKTIQAMGSKIGSKQMMKKAGVPVLPGTNDGICDIGTAKTRRSTRATGSLQRTTGLRSSALTKA